jgi:hypothetical protein
MPEPAVSTPLGLTTAIDSAWAEFQAFLAVVSEDQASLQDANGWTIKDHVTHIAVWEDSVSILFRGGRRHEALGIDEPFFREGSFDQINEIIKVRYRHLQLADVLRKLNEVHNELMSRSVSVTDQLQTTVHEFFPRALTMMTGPV